MKEALRLMNLPGELCFSAKGDWLHRDKQQITKVSHSGVASYFSKNLRFSSEHNSYVIVQGDSCIKVLVEDCPFVLIHFEIESENWRWVLNSEESDILSPNQKLFISSNNQLYLEIEGLRGMSKAIEVILSRTASQQIWPHIEKVLDQKEDSFTVRYGNSFMKISSRREQAA